MQSEVSKKMYPCFGPKFDFVPLFKHKSIDFYHFSNIDNMAQPWQLFC